MDANAGDIAPETGVLLAGSDNGNRQMVDILAAVLTDGLPAVEAACAEGDFPFGGKWCVADQVELFSFCSSPLYMTIRKCDPLIRRENTSGIVDR